MKFLWFVVSGLIGGAFAGMGMGGGTFLIPLLNIFYDVEQHLCQAINLISFIPMAVISLILHFKNKLVDTKGVLYIIIPGTLTAIGGCFLAKIIKGELLKRIFGGFLIGLAILQLILFIKEVKKGNKKVKEI
ncbi:MAG: sulfite exporter TauE/SafE family protein [Clostridiales bacterium]|nr:sulfite exporter TauE/SafE family protein [Clostridiales bacterium]